MLKYFCTRLSCTGVPIWPTRVTNHYGHARSIMGRAKATRDVILSSVALARLLNRIMASRRVLGLCVLVITFFSSGVA